MKKGITLVALVITIIILLILTTVTISVLVGENSLFRKTKESTYKTELNEIVDRLNSASSAIVTDVLIRSISDKTNKTEVLSRLLQYDAPDAHIISATDAFNQPSESQGIYTLTYRPELSEWTLIYTLNLETNKPAHVIVHTP